MICRPFVGNAWHGQGKSSCQCVEPQAAWVQRQSNLLIVPNQASEPLFPMNSDVEGLIH